MKRIFDIVFSFCVLVFLSPVFLVIGLLIKLDSRGPIIFSQKRVGLNGHSFKIYKFRTMKYDHSPARKLDYVKQGDPRITTLGRILRNTSIDELPQFFNVLKGEMSIVGPRPQPIEEVKYISSKIKDFPKRHSIRPGITGLVQISDMRSSVDTLKEQEKRFKLDMDYIHRQSFLLDMFVVIKTIWTMTARYNVANKIYPRKRVPKTNF